ncbi:MAG: rhomboid family intramembrane serine protease, partial [Actinobacteria bacterium]|nr:rhomboid family intramembrane serine protease [Actinomycetota bacterium]
MIPLRDDNPTRRVPVLTLLLILANVGIYFLVQPHGMAGSESEAARFSFQYAAIPCEIITGEPLSREELP